MSDQLPPNPYRCDNCRKLCEKPHRSCPGCGKTGTIVVRENLEEAASSTREADSDDESYRCIDCGNVYRRPHKECPRCGSQSVAPRGRRAPPSQQFMDMMMRW